MGGMAESIMSDPASTLDRAAFIARFGGIYEHSAWIAEQAFDSGALPTFLSGLGRSPAGELRTFSEAHELGVAMAAILAASTDEQKLALVLAHPDLVGRAALAGDLTDESTTEQSSAGLDRCTGDELERFTQANAAYRARFGFPFIMAVRGADRQQILANFERRLKNTQQQEFNTALAEIDRIALLRLEATVNN